MGDHDQRGRAGHQVLGQPGDRLDVEVVGGLVEDDQVVLVEQQRGQRAAPPLAAGQPDDGAVEGDPGEQLLDDLAGAGSAAHSWSGVPASTASRTVCVSTSSSPWWR